VNPSTATLPLTLGPSDFPFDFVRESAALADADRGAGAGGGGGGAFEGVRTLACFAFVQLDSDGFDGAATPESGMAQTTNAEMTSRSDARSKNLMINRIPGSRRVVCPCCRQTEEKEIRSAWAGIDGV